jgi:hypothetical protein
MDLISLYFLGLLCAFAPVIASEAKQSGENPTRHCEPRSGVAIQRKPHTSLRAAGKAIQREKGGSFFIILKFRIASDFVLAMTGRDFAARRAIHFKP